jgi:hypothetical protein
MDCRLKVSEADATDVVDMLHESLLDAITLDTGKIDFGRKGGMSMAKQVPTITVSLSKSCHVTYRSCDVTYL